MLFSCDQIQYEYMQELLNGIQGDSVPKTVISCGINNIL